MTKPRLISSNASIFYDFLQQRLLVGDQVLFFVYVHGGYARMAEGTIKALFEDQCTIEYEDAAGGSRKSTRECCNVVLVRNK